MKSKGSWILKIDPDAYKILSKVPGDTAEKILDIIGHLPSNPYFGDIRKIKGEKNLWRRRIGAYRIFYEIDLTEKLIHIT